MGFDDGECYICYAHYGGNNPSGRAQICFICFGEKIEEIKKPYLSGRWTGGLQEAIKEHWIESGTCCVCQKDRKMLLNLSLCSEHGGGECSDSEDD